MELLAWALIQCDWCLCEKRTEGSYAERRLKTEEHGCVEARSEVFREAGLLGP